MKPARYRELSVEGTPRDIGHQIGESARDEVRGFCEIALERVNKTARVSHASAMKIVAGSLPFAEAYSADMVEELRGIAEAADVPFEEIMLLQIRNQLQPDADAGCTSLAMRPDATRASGIVAQNWDNDSALDPFTIVLTRHPEGKPSLTTLTQAGLIAYIGFNDAGIGLCLNTLPAPSRPLGVPHYFTVRGILEAHSLDQAVDAVSRAHRAIPANIMLITPQGPADLEVTMDAVHVLRNDLQGIAHTNHCVHPELKSFNQQFPELIQSHDREQRIEALVDFRQEELSLDAVKQVLRDHDGYPRSICRHANDDAVTGFWRTVFSVIIEPVNRRMLVTRGTPCDREYEAYTMS